MKHELMVFASLMFLIMITSAYGADVILNEYNGVRDDMYLKDNSSDTYWGRVLGNGGDWFELVVITDNLNMSGWSIDVYDNGALNATLVLSLNPIWSNIRSGTIITISENLADDVSYEPCNDDWWINVCANDSRTGAYISAKSFSVSHNNTQIVIKDAFANIVFGPAGEGINPVSGIGNDEVFKLEQDPSALITPTGGNYKDGTSSTFGAPNVWSQGANVQDFSALRAGVCIPEPATLSLIAFGGLILYLRRRK